MLPALPARPARPAVLLAALLLGSWLFPAPASAGPAAAGQPPALEARRLSVEEGLSQNTVISFFSDHQGFLWIGTLDGLNRYDGRHFQTLSAGPAGPLPQATIRGLAEDRFGELWISTEKGLVHYRRDLSAIEALPAAAGEIAGGAGGHLLLMRDGSFWLASERGAEHFDTSSRRVVRRVDAAAGLPDGRATALFEDSRGRLLIGTSGGLARFDPADGRLETLIGGRALAAGAPYVRAIFEDGAGRLFVATKAHGLLRRDADPSAATAGAAPSAATGRGGWRAYRQQDGSGLASDTLSALLPADGGALWVSTDLGLQLFDPAADRFATLPFLDSRHGEEQAQPITGPLGRDLQGGLWVGTTDGAFRLAPSAFRRFRHRADGQGPLHDNIWSLYEDRAGALWVGSSLGLSRYDGKSWRHFAARPGDRDALPHPAVRCLLEDERGALWVGTDGGGLAVLDPAGRFRTYRHDPLRADSLPADGVRSLLQARDGSLYVGTLGGLARLDRATGRFSSADPGGGPATYYSLHEDAAGRIWAGLLGGGLRRFDPRTGEAAAFAAEPERPGALGDANVTWVGEAAGRIAAATFSGVYLLRPDGLSFDRIGLGQGLPNEVAYAALEDGQGQLFIPTNNGLARCQPPGQAADQGAGAPPLCRGYTVGDGLPGSEFNGGAHHRGRSGRLYFGGPRGLVTVDSEQLRPNTFVPPVVISAIRLEGRRLDGLASPELKLSWRDDYLAFDLAALNFQLPERNLYSWRLSGVDPGWSPASTRSEALYSHLEPGEYLFEARGSNDEGLWNEKGIRLRVVVVPPWWRAAWAYLLYAAAAAGLAVAAYRYRFSKLDRSRLALSAEVARRTADLETLVSELQRSERQAQEAKEAALAGSRAKAEFLANMSHEIRTPMNSVIGMTGLLLESNLDPRQRIYAETVRSSGNALLALLADVLDFSKIESGRLDLEVLPFRLRDCVEESLELVATAAAGKHLELCAVFAPEVPNRIRQDVTRLRQVLINLTSNAVKFTAAGEVVVEAGARLLNEAEKQRLASELPDLAAAMGMAGQEQDAPCWEISFTVRDTGIGIPAEGLENLFESFTQVDASTTRRFGGSGLGLAICKRLVEKMGGSIKVASEPGRGSAFSFTVLAQGADDETQSWPSRRPRLLGRKALVLESHAVARAALAGQLEALGLDVQLAASEEELLELPPGAFELAILATGPDPKEALELLRRWRERHASELPPAEPPPALLLMPVGSRLPENLPGLAFLGKPPRIRMLRELLPVLLGEEMDQPAYQKIGRARNLRILLVEDNGVNQLVATAMLEQLGCRSDVAANGLEALEAIRRQTYDLVLMDVQMPEMDGLTAARKIREMLPPEKAPRIVALTAGAFEADRQSCLEAGMDDYLAKPIRLESLAALLRRQPARRP